MQVCATFARVISCTLLYKQPSSSAVAIKATFERRKTGLPGDVPAALLEGHATLPTTTTMWRAFVGRSLGERDADLRFVAGVCRGFVMPVAQGLKQHGEFAGTWEPGGPWGIDDRIS